MLVHMGSVETAGWPSGPACRGLGVETQGKGAVSRADKEHQCHFGVASKSRQIGSSFWESDFLFFWAS